MGQAAQMAVLKASDPAELPEPALTHHHTSLFSPSEAVSWASLATISGSGCWGGARGPVAPVDLHRLLPPPCPDPPCAAGQAREKDSPMGRCRGSQGPSWLPGLREPGLNLLAPDPPSLPTGALFSLGHCPIVCFQTSHPSSLCGLSPVCHLPSSHAGGPQSVFLWPSWGSWGWVNCQKLERS